MKSVKAEEGGLFFPPFASPTYIWFLPSETPGSSHVPSPQGPAPLPLAPPPGASWQKSSSY